MRIAITGATGFIGKRLVEYLEPNHSVIAIGRDANRLNTLFSNVETFTYTELKPALNEVEIVIHLAAALPNAALDEAGFREANVVLTKEIAREAKSAGAKLFINAATLGWSDNAYTRTKYEAEIFLNSEVDLPVFHMRLPYVYGERYPNKLSWLNKLPRPLPDFLFNILGALRPSVHVDAICVAVSEVIAKRPTGENIVSDRQRNNWVYWLLKRTIDLGFSFAVLIILSWWLFPFLALLIRLETPGPAIFKQTRVGRNKQHFTLYKLRSMLKNTKSVGTHEVEEYAVTSIGKFMRRWKLDELPQVLNILRGELTLVGPRPCLPSQTKLIEARQDSGVFESLPGLTGLAQINDVDMSEPYRLAAKDAEYLALKTIFFDIKIILATALGRGSGDQVRLSENKQ